MTVYTEAELAYLQGERRLAHVATVGGRHPTSPRSACGASTPAAGSWRSPATKAATKKFRDVARSGRAAIVVDDVLPPWRPRGVEVRGHAEAVDGPQPSIRIRPTRIVAWGLDDTGGARNARDTSPER